MTASAPMTIIALLVALLPVLSHAQADEEASARANSWYVHGGGYVHFSDDPDYEGPAVFAGMEYHRPGKALLGLSVFNNSFGQFSQYAYVGKTFHPWSRHPRWRIKLTGGVVHGYRGERQKIFQVRWGDAWGLGIVPTIGYQKEALGFDVALLANSGLLFLLGYEFGD